MLNPSICVHIFRVSSLTLLFSICQSVALANVTLHLYLGFFGVILLGSRTLHIFGSCCTSSRNTVTIDAGKELSALGLTAHIKHAPVHVVQVLLLRSKNGARSSDSDPTDEGGGGESVVLHAVESNESACAAKSSLAVNGDGSVIADFVLCGSEELGHDFIGWGSSIKEVQVEMLDALLGKFGLLILRLVQSDDQRDSHSLEDGHVVIWSERTVSICHVQRTRKGHELAWDDPVEVTILDLLEVLVLLHIEVAIVVPA